MVELDYYEWILLDINFLFMILVLILNMYYSPLMVSTQRLTSLAYNLADGAVLEKDANCKLSPVVRKLAIR